MEPLSWSKLDICHHRQPRRQAISTADRILDTTQDLIQTKGYNAISFNEIADIVGIKKPSIVHHFSSKAVLGRAVVQRYREQFGTLLSECLANKSHTSMDAFELYCQPYRDTGAGGDKVCLCGSLAGELLALPDEMQSEVRGFFASHIDWLEQILEAGLASGEFKFEQSPKVMAGVILHAMQGALIVMRSTGDVEQIENTIASLKGQLKN